MLKEIQKTREYLDYLEEHYNNVQKAWEILKEKCQDMAFIWDDWKYWHLDGRIKDHDKSKLSQEEFIAYRQFFYPVDEEEKEGAKEAFKDAWENHKKENRHHWENWTEIHKKEKQLEEENGPLISAVEMDVVENVVDWMAMAMKFGDTARDYYEKNKDKIDLPEWAEKFMYEIFDRVYPK